MCESYTWDTFVSFNVSHGCSFVFITSNKASKVDVVGIWTRNNFIVFQLEVTEYANNNRNGVAERCSLLFIEIL